MIVKPFPIARIERVALSPLLGTVGQKGIQRRLKALAEVVSEMARELGLGGAKVTLKRARGVSAEDLRMQFPGRWGFACFADPLVDRRGFLSLDPLLVGRVVSRFVKGAWVGRAMGIESEGQWGLVGWMAARALNALAERDAQFDSWRFCGVADSLGEIVRSQHIEDEWLGCWIQVEAGWDQGCAVWLESAGSVQRAKAPTMDTNPDIGDVSTLGLQVPWVVGRSELSCGELAALQVGDVILMGEDLSCSFVFELGALRIVGRRKEKKVVVEEIQFNWEERVMKHGEAEIQEPKACLKESDLSQLPVVLVLEAGRMEMTVGELSDLRPGDVLAFPEAVLGPVDCWSGKHLLVRGELVDVEGRRGVRVVERVGFGGNHVVDS
jgi:flagellar motor switch protein FliN